MHSSKSKVTGLNFTELQVNISSDVRTWSKFSVSIVTNYPYNNVSIKMDIRVFKPIFMVFAFPHAPLKTKPGRPMLLD